MKISSFNTYHIRGIEMMNLLGELQNNGIEFDIIFVQEARPSMIEYVSKNSDFKYNYYKFIKR